MSYGIQKTYSIELASSVTLSSALDLGKPYNKVYLHVPTMASGSLYIQAAGSSTGTFRRVYEDIPNQDTAFVINSATTQALVPIPHGLQFIKIENTSGSAGTTSFQLVCSD